MQPRVKFRPGLNSPWKRIICVGESGCRGGIQAVGASEPELVFLHLLFLAALGPCFSMRAFSSGGERGYSLVAGHGLLIAAASLVEHWLQSKGSIVVSQGLNYTESMWDLPRPGFKPMSPALAGGFFTTEPAGRPPAYSLLH